MKLLFVYDSLELSEISSIITKNNNDVEEVHVLTIDEYGKKRNLYSVAVELKNNLSENESSIIFIDHFLSCSDDEFELVHLGAGIALIKFLRILYVRCHIVLISPIPVLDIIKQSPNNLIVTSKGVSIAKYLHEFRDEPIIKLEKIASDTFDDKQKIKSFILAEFRIPEDERHNWANWWGIFKLWEIHKHFDKDYESYIQKCKQDAFINYILIKAPNIYDKIIKLTGQQTKYLYGFNETELQYAIMNKEISDLTYRIKEIRSDKQIQVTLLKNLPNANAPRKKLDILEEELVEIERDIRIKLQQSQNTKRAKIIDDSAISNLRNKLKQKNARILLIDDQAEDGWSEIFQLMIYDEKQNEETFKAIHDFTNKSVEEIYIIVKDEINRLNPDLILLDLRLKNESGTWHNISELSGSFILDNIRIDFPGIPIMMTTASNKVWTYREIMKVGADTFWTKEGIDVSSVLDYNETIKLSIENYEKFLDQILKLTGEEYKHLHWFTNEILKLKTNKTHWWTLRDRFKKGTIPAQNPAEIFDILDDTVFIIRDFIQTYVLKQKRSIFNNDWFYPSLIIQNLGKIIEKLHHNGNPNLIIRKDTFRSRLDDCGLKLFEIRNNASHVDLVKDIRIEDSNAYIKNIIGYLNDREHCII